MSTPRTGGRNPAGRPLPAVNGGSPINVTKGKTATSDELPEVGREVGTAFTSADLMFRNFDDGSLFSYGEMEAKDMREMLGRYGKGHQLEAALTLPLMGLEWELEKPDGDKGQTKWLTEFLDRPANTKDSMSTPMDLILGQMTSALTYKKACFEKVFETDDDDMFIYDKVAFRPPSTVDVRRDPKTAAFLGFQQTPITVEQQNSSKMLPIKIDPQYAFVHFNGLHRDPVNGLSAMEIPFWCYKTQEKIMYLWFNFLEGQALPRTIVEANELGIATEIARKVAALKNSGVLPVANPNGAQAAGRQMVYTLDSSGKGADQFMAAINWLEQTALDSAHAGFTGLASAATNGRGSNALASTMSNFFLKNRQGDVRAMKYSLDSWFLPDLTRYNFGPDALPPRIKFAPLAEADLQMSMELLGTLAGNRGGAEQFLPNEFLSQIVLNVSRYMELDVKQVQSGIEKAQKRAEEQAALTGAPPEGQAVAGVGGATQQALKIIQGGQPGQPPTNQPPIPGLGG